MKVPDPIIRVTDVAFPRFQAPDLDEMERFLSSFGMARSGRTDTALYMRGTDAAHHLHVTHRGPPAFLGLAFRAASRDDLSALARRTRSAVEPLDEPGGGEVVRLRDPDGRRIDVVHGTEPLPPLALRSHPPLNTGADRMRLGTLQRVEPGPAQVKRFGHAAIKTADLDALSHWYREHLGLLVSDDFHAGEPGQPLGRFLRCDRGAHPVDHHSLLVLATGEVKLGHAAWEVADFDDLMVGHDHLERAGYRAYWGVGRHVLGGQIFDYWKDPIGFTVEHWTDSDLLAADDAPASHHILSALNQWGPPPPADLDF
jgi:catechol 2,3-dioxygenase-like lactoylglutathione lyase family enzyme